MGRRTGTLTCLVLTALTLWLLPGSLRGLTAGDDPAERLAPREVRLLTVWLIGDDADCAAPLSRLMTIFERERGDVRVRLRRADASELLAETAVRPDAVLLCTYALDAPEACLLPLCGELPAREDALCAGRSALTQYAVPLWFSPTVLAVSLADATAAPAEDARGWLSPGGTAAAPSPTPEAAWRYADSPASHERIPWDSLWAGGITGAHGAALPQLVLSAPPRLRAALAERLAIGEPEGWAGAGASGASVRAESGATNHGGGADAIARVSAYRAWRRGGAGAAYALSPAACDRALFIGLCREGDAARALLAFLLSPAAQAEVLAEGLFSCARDALWPGDTEAARALSGLYRPGLVLANAFAHTRAEADALCRAGLADPAAALLRLR